MVRATKAKGKSNEAKAKASVPAMETEGKSNEGKAEGGEQSNTESTTQPAAKEPVVEHSATSNPCEGEPEAKAAEESEAKVAEEPIAKVAEESEAKVAEEPENKVAEEPEAKVAEEPEAKVAEEPKAKAAEPEETPKAQLASTNPFESDAKDAGVSSDAASVEQPSAAIQPEATGTSTTAAGVEPASAKPVLAPAGGIMSVLNESADAGRSEAAEVAPPRPPAAESEAAVPATASEGADAGDVKAEAVSEACDEFSGEYHWRSKDGTREGVLRLRPGGQWWHAAHQSPIINIDNAPPPSPDGNGSAKSGKIWEMAECLGSWQLDEGAGALSLTCENCRWSSDKPDQAHVYKPSEQKMTEIDDLVASGVMVFYYVPGRCPTTGRKRLEFLVKENYRLPVEARMLGFSRGYYKVSADDNENTILPSSEDLLDIPQRESELCVIS